MFNVRVITLAIGAAAALSAAPLASANGPIAAATATDDHNRGQGQPGDDKSTQAEPGDDMTRNVAASAAAGAIKTKAAAKARRHTHIRHVSHRVAAK